MSVKRVFDGLTLVTVGGILLANTTGVLPWSVWFTIVMLWPLLLVSLGIDILGRSLGSPVLRAVSSLVVIAGLLYGALAGGGRIEAPILTSASGGRVYNLSEPADPSITTGTARVAVGLSTVTLRAGNELATVSGSSPFGTPTLEAGRSGGSADVRIASGERGVVVPGAGRARLDVRLGQTVAWDPVTVDGGLCDMDIDLSGLQVQAFEANVGLSNARVTFGLPKTTSAETAVARISGGLSSFTLRVPRGLGVEVVSNNGLGSVDVPDDWMRVSGSGTFEGTWRSDGYDTSTAKLRIEVKTGLTSVTVQRY